MHTHTKNNRQDTVASEDVEKGGLRRSIIYRMKLDDAVSSVWLVVIRAPLKKTNLSEVFKLMRNVLQLTFHPLA